MKPRVFIASSVEGLKIAYAVQENLEYDAECTVWSQGVFNPSAYPLDDLLVELERTDFGIFVFSADDVVNMRKEETKVVRDNVIFELGLFLGKLGRQRNFMVQPNDVGELHIPSDLAGLIPLRFEAKRQDGRIVAALGASCNKIREAMRKLGPVTETVDNVVSALDEKCLAFMHVFAQSEYFAAPPDQSFSIQVFDHAVARLRSLNALRFDSDGQKYAYHWTELGKLVLDKFGMRKTTGQTATQSVGEVRPVNNLGLSEAASELLAVAVQDKQAKIYMSSTLHGLTIHSNGRNFVDGTNPKEESKWRGAVRDLERRQLIEDLGSKREVFRVTDNGFKAAEATKN